MEAGTLGTYDGSFFNKLDSEIEVSEACNLLHLRAVVQDFNMEFANRMRKFGHKYNVDERPQHDTGSSSIVPAKWGGVRLAKKKKNSVAFPELQGHYKSDDCDGNFAAFQDPAVPVPVRLTHAEAIEWVLIKLRRSRGRELPGIFNPELIGHLFQEQSNKWKTIAQDHIDRVALSCKDFVAEVLSYVALEDVKTKLLVLTIENALKSAHGLATAELKRIIDDKMRHPITYNHYFTDSLQKMQRNKHAAWVNEAMKVGEEDEFSFDQSDDKLNRLIDRSKLQKAMDESLEQNMDRWSAEQALDAQTAYYKDELKYFINVVAKQVVERHLIDPLPTTLEAMTVALLKDDEVAYVAAEPNEVILRRKYLEDQKEMLEKGQVAFRKGMGQLR